MAKEVMHRRFVCVESGYGEQGHNKFWYITVYDNGELKTEWGRVGDPGGDKESMKSFGSQEKALSEADKLISKKQKGKPVKGSDQRDSVYSEVEIAGIVQASGTKVTGKNLEQQAASQIAKGDKVIEQLVADLAKENVHNITNNTTMQYDAATGLFSTPLGVIGQNSINQARTVLAQIRDLVDTDDFENKKSPSLVDEYMRLVPQNVGRNRPTLKLICGSLTEVDKQVSILDSLQASVDMLNKPKDAGSDKKAEEAKIWDITFKLCSNNKEIDRIKKFYDKTRQSRHTSSSLDVKRVFEFDHHGMSKAFENRMQKWKANNKKDNTWQLWHGTRVGNLLSIMAKGMMIPPSNAGHCTGRMFGDGLYFSDQSTKSLNYAQGYWSGKRENKCFMFLVDVAMGEAHTPQTYGRNFPVKGSDSTFAKGGLSGVMNNEMIVYNTNQAKTVYLIEFA